MTDESKFETDDRPSSLRKRLVPKLTISENPSEVFAVQFSPDGQLLAAGCNDGEVRIYHTATGRIAYSLRDGAGEALPITAIKFRPASSSSKTKNVLLAVGADGAVKHWHITSSKCMHTMFEPHNQLFCAEYRKDGDLFATAGKDRKIRLYDEATKDLISELSSGIAHVTPGHSNRVFSLKFDPNDDNTIVSGGWDNTVQIWDVRVGHAVRSFFGPHIAGDAVDVMNGVVLTGSWRPESPLEMWDLASGRLIETVKWDQGALSSEPCPLYTAKFSKDSAGSFIAAGGSGANEAKVFDRRNGNQLVGTVAGLTKSVFSVDWYQHRYLAIAGGDAAVRLFEIHDSLDGAGDSESKGEEAL